MKKMMSFALAILMLLSFAGCKRSKTEDEGNVSYQQYYVDENTGDIIDANTGEVVDDNNLIVDKETGNIIDSSTGETVSTNTDKNQNSQNKNNVANTNSTNSNNNTNDKENENQNNEVSDNIEYIELSSEEDIYALSRLLAYDYSQGEYIYKDGSVSKKTDIMELDLPIENPTQNITNTVNYLKTANFKLTKDMNLVFKTGTGKDFFMGIGSMFKCYAGVFNGNNKTITLSSEINVSEIDPKNINLNFGLFGHTKGATIKNLKVKVADDITYSGINSRYNNSFFGVLCGGAIDTTINSCTIDVSDAIIGTPNLSPGKKMLSMVGIVAGRIETTNINDCHITLKNSQIKVNADNDNYLNSYIGGIVGKVQGFEGNRCTISNCSVKLDNSNIETKAFQAHVGGVVGDGTKLSINNADSIFNNSYIKATGDSVYTSYAALSIGGVLGFAVAGCENDGSANVGMLGCELNNCNFTSNNSSAKDVLYAEAVEGGELAVGGLIGCSFNNFKAKNSTATFKNANIVAHKTTPTDSRSFGTSVGGIIGRLEHTGEIYNCKVTGNHLNIVSKSAENNSYAGGVVGVDIGPFNYDLVSINKCSFNGYGTSTIKVETTPNSPVSGKNVCAGGIVGEGTYKILNCSVKDVKIINNSAGIFNKAYSGGIVGRYYKHSLGVSGKYFTPGTYEITGCTTKGVTFENSNNVLVGETYGVKTFKN